MIPAHSQLTADEGVVLRFLTEVIGKDIHLAAIVPDGKIHGHYFGGAIEAAAEWVTKYNLAGRNIYWTANRCHPDAGSKPSKEEILSARFAHVDIDPPKNGSSFDKAEVISDLKACSLPPSVIVDSGNGIQALWRLAEDSGDLERVEVANRAIIRRFAGDSGYNFDKLMRVPGTVNYPNAAKLRRGCVPVMSRLVSHCPERRFTLDELESVFPSAAVSPELARASVEVPGNIALLTSDDLSRGDTHKLAMMLDHPEKHFRSDDRSAWVYGIACQMVDDSYSDAEVLGVLINPANEGSAHVGDQADPMRAATRALSKAKARYTPAGGSIFEDEASHKSNRPTISVVPGNLPETVDQAQQALIEADLGYFQMSGRIVRTGLMPATQVGRRAGTRLRIVMVGEAEMVEALTKVANWEKPTKGGQTKIDCPSVVAETLLARTGRWKLSPLMGLLDVPTLRANGSLLSQPGYDVATGLLLVPSETEVPRLPVAPTRHDALAALELLRDLISGFPFVAEADRSVALSALLTSTSRTALGSAPLHGFSATTAGSGKSTLVDLGSVLRTGREAAPIAQGRTAEELEKRLAALLLEGEGIIAIDNCETPLGGEFLCQLMTQPSLKVRPLGQSAMIEVPTTAMVSATGNNLMLVGDMSRRALLCQLDPGVERPELREFSFDPVQWAKDRRGEYVAAALTILLAYHIAGRPFQVAPLGSFADWSNWVRSALIWLGCADPCDTMEKVRKADPQMALIKHVMGQWIKVIGDKKVTTSDLGAVAEEMEDAASVSSATKKYKHPEFREALLSVAGEGGRINGRRLGRWLSAQQGRVVAGYKFMSPSLRGGQAVWVMKVAAAQPSAAPAEGD
jgi:hypothetical protein